MLFSKKLTSVFTSIAFQKQWSNFVIKEGVETVFCHLCSLIKFVRFLLHESTGRAFCVRE